MSEFSKAVGLTFVNVFIIDIDLLVGLLCLTSHRQRGHLETAPPFTVPCVGREDVAWQSIALPLRYASSTDLSILYTKYCTLCLLLGGGGSC